MHDYEGTVVSEAAAAEHLGFATVEDYRAWVAAGSPTGRCGNEHCWEVVLWPHLYEPCPECGCEVDVTVSNRP